MINQDHWQELAEQLGLEPAKPGEASPPIHEAPPAPKVEEHPRAEQAAEETAAPEQETGYKEEQPWDAPIEAPQVEVPEASVEVEAVPPEQEPGQARESEGRGRRGHRRGARFAKERAPTDPAKPRQAKEAPFDEEGEAPRGRGRRRGRGRQRPESGKPSDHREEAIVEESETPADVVPASVDAEDDMDDLSNWQAPSWQELIGSLYRPDR